MQSLPAERGPRRMGSIIKPLGPIPVSRSTWWAGAKSGRFLPAPLKLWPGITARRDADIQRLIESGIGAANDTQMPATIVGQAGKRTS